MKIITSTLCLLAVLTVGCDEINDNSDRTASLPESLLEQGWTVEDDGQLVRELEDGTIERVLPEGGLVSEPPQPDDGPTTPGFDDAPDGLTAEPDTQAVLYGVWTHVSSESCGDLFGSQCGWNVPYRQCETGSTCALVPGASWCWDVQSPWSVDLLHCRT